ncbi:hypothetical protein KK062_17640 [Fulvivirgaceae bacterium PWU5]|uniref:Lipoprotein n=1 Tax=Dawidia cretensis TaxID=2782350 RepID=A0AAP2E165_9BACT|nr:hypothetical protein [Dawidia cretensis]MBT1710073.1 hypothetical protein [Dawidia cretensis]
MLRAFFVLFICSLFLTACTQRMICPAYQSAFIYDKDALRKQFSYFQDDSTPKVLTASKNKYLIAEPTSYRKKIRSMQTVPMKNVYVQVPDSLKEGYDSLGLNGEDGVVPGAELDLAARSVIDSIYIEDVPQDTTSEEAEGDSIYVITKDKELRMLRYEYSDTAHIDPATGKMIKSTPKYVVTEITFNVEQDNYMWYLRNYLVLPDVRLAKLGQAETAKEEKAAKKKGGFFKNLFKKKQKEQPADSVVAPEPRDDDFDYVDEEEQQKQVDSQLSQPEPEKEKKGLFKRKKKKEPKPETDEPEKPAKKKKEKKSKKKADEDQPEETPAEEKEESDDGF